VSDDTTNPDSLLRAVAAAPPAQAPRPLARSARFEIVRRIGAGGMGIVYEAIDRQRETRVALKTLRNLDGGSLLRFKREYRSLQGLLHPNLVSLGDLVEEDGSWLFTMDLVRGVEFLRWVRGDEPNAAVEGATPRVTAP
jgi:eukaryotic-like serine/threonine-protein kinase